MRVLISAYACEPGSGSEPGVGWAWTQAAAEAGHEVWLVTRKNNAQRIKVALGTYPGLDVRPIYYDLPDRLRRWKRGRRGGRTYYLLWQLSVRRLLQRLHAEHGFHVAHHLTFAIDWMPAAAIGLPGLPSVWGPVGGSGSVPCNLYRWLGLKGATYEVIREVAVSLVRSHIGYRVARAATLVIAQNSDVAANFRHVATDLTVEPNVAISASVAVSVAPGPEYRYFSNQMVFVGRLIPLKGLALAVAALSILPEPWGLLVVGEGPDRLRCERLASRLGVRERVRFCGSVHREEVWRALVTSDVLILPSMHDSAGWVMGEAGAAGTPVVCLALGGPRTMAEKGGGIAVETKDPVKHLARAVRLADSGGFVNSVRWSDRRLAKIVDEWYRQAAPELGR